MLELQAVLNRTVEFVTAMLPADGGCSLILWDEDQQKFTISTSTVPKQKDKQLAAKRVRTSGGATRWIVDNGEPLIVPDVRNDPFSANQILHEYSIHAYIGMPLIVGDTVEGVLYAMNLTIRNYQPNDVKLLSDCANIIALAISKSRIVHELEQANEALELYVRTVTHDIRSPLSIAMGYLNLVNTRDNLTDAEKQKYLQTSEKMLWKSVQIIDELLLLTSIRGDYIVDNSLLDMPIIITEVEERMCPLLQEAGASIILPTCWSHQAVGYAPWVEEIWVNFINNAVKYGGSPPEIELGSTLEEHEVRFWIRDNGNGLSHEQQQTLFEPFTRFDSVRVQGHGLGLSIVRHIAERMNGTVGVQSEVGCGSQFYFTLPKATSI